MQTGEPAMTAHVDGGDYNLRVLIERMQRAGTPERDIELAVREAQRGGPLWKREEGQR